MRTCNCNWNWDEETDQCKEIDTYIICRTRCSMIGQNICFKKRKKELLCKREIEPYSSNYSCDIFADESFFFCFFSFGSHTM